MLVAGWTATGKTRFAVACAARLPGAVVLPLDDYYRDTSALPRAQRVRLDFDRPEALDLDDFARDLATLRSGAAVPCRRYHVSSGRCCVDGTRGPARYVIAEGVFTLNHPAVGALADFRVLLTGEPDRLFQRRLARDTVERGYSSAEVHRMFHCQAWPAQTHYLADAAARVDLILPMDWGEADVERCLRRFRTAAEAKGHP